MVADNHGRTTAKLCRESENHNLKIHFRDEKYIDILLFDFDGD
jgi:hypothetical protein